MNQRISRRLLFCALIVALPAAGYPIAAAVTHGLDPSLWPPSTTQPLASIAAIKDGHIWPTVLIYWDMFNGQSPGLIGGGKRDFIVLMFTQTMFVIAALAQFGPRSRRDPTGTFG